MSQAGPITVAQLPQSVAAVAWMPGVVTDGVTDNSAVITAAMQPPFVKTPPLPPGVIACNVTVPAGVTLDGSGSWDDIGPAGNTNGTKLVPFTAGQAAVLTLGGNMSSVQNLTVDGLLPANAKVAQSALYVNATGCKGRNVCFLGGSVATLKGNGTNATQFELESFTIRTNDNTGTTEAINTTGNDWQAIHGVVNGCIGSTLNGPASVWTDVHFVSGGSVSTKNSLIRDKGQQTFVGCYFDGVSGGNAMIDRTGATGRSTYVASRLLQSQAGVTGIPIFQESTGANSGAIILGLTATGLASGSSFTYLLKGAISSTTVHAVTMDTGWLTSDAAPFDVTPPGSVSGVAIGGVATSDFTPWLTTAAGGTLTIASGINLVGYTRATNTTIANYVQEFFSNAGTALTHTLSQSSNQLLIFRNIGTATCTLAAPGFGSAPSIDGLASIQVPPGRTVICQGTSNAAGTWTVLQISDTPALQRTPTLAALTHAGTSPPTPTLVSGSTDMQGAINFGTGTTPSAGGQASVTFGAALITAPLTVLVSNGPYAGSAFGGVINPYATLMATTGFSIGFQSAPGASQSVGAYIVSYKVILP